MGHCTDVVNTRFVRGDRLHRMFARYGSGLREAGGETPPAYSPAAEFQPVADACAANTRTSPDRLLVAGVLPFGFDCQRKLDQAANCF
jgi:hypothetical protein